MEFAFAVRRWWRMGSICLGDLARTVSSPAAKIASQTISVKMLDSVTLLWHYLITVENCESPGGAVLLGVAPFCCASRWRWRRVWRNSGMRGGGLSGRRA